MFPDKNYTLGAGQLFFDKFLPGTKTPTGQRYFGNTPELTVTSESEVLDHFDADNGVRQKDDAVTLELNRTGEFTCDHIAPENLALFFLGDASVTSQVADPGQTETFTDAKMDHRYQLGVTVSNPAGVRDVSNVVVKVGVTTMTLNDDYTIDSDTGGVIPLSSGAINEGDDVIVEYDIDATTFNTVISSGSASVEGALFFKSNNPKGKKMDYFWPYVVIRPNGDFALKSADEWQTLGYSVEFLKRDDETEVVYINGRPADGV
jgi:hypothetical protein